MPIRQRRRTTNPGSAKLRERLAEEWRNPRDDVDEPVIIEEGGASNRPTHFYVIWSKWAELNQQERSEIIMDAHEDVHGADASLRVTVAMGLTSEEAERMGIQYE